MIGIIDIGNTRIHCAIFEGYELKREEKIENPFKIKDFFKGTDEILMISVVPETEELLSDLLDITHIPFPKEIVELEYKSEVGADRLANGIGVGHIKEFPSVVVDCGSAINIDHFNNSEDNNCLVKFNGGAIIPGLHWYFSSLSEGRLLPEIPPEFRETPGKSTEECIEFGAYGSLIGGIREILNKIEYKKLIFTGGDGELFAEKFNKPYDPFLTLKGGIIAYHHVRG